MTTRREKGLCGICSEGCGIECEIEDNRIVKIHPWKEHPQGRPCLRGLHAPEIVHSPDRLTKPLKRKGPKGTLDFEEVSWDQALDEIAETILKLKDQYGPECIASFLGRGNFEQSLWRMFTPNDPGFSVPNSIFMPLGSPNTFSVGSICYISHGLLAPITTYGAPGGLLQPDIENADVIFLWGSNPETDSPPSVVPRIQQARKRGAKLVVVDPIQTSMAQKADLWIPVLPSTDGALILGLLHQCVQYGRVDKPFIEQFCKGYSAFEEYLKQFTPRTVENMTGVPESLFLKLAEIFSATEKAVFLSFSGMEFTNSGVQAYRALLTLWALTGHLDVKGGMQFMLPTPTPFQKPRVSFPTESAPIGMDRYPFLCQLIKNGHFMEFPRAVLSEDPYKIRFLLIGGASILTNFPSTTLFEDALKGLDYQVCVDLFLNADAKYADMVLPSTTHFEMTSFCGYPNESPMPYAIQYRRKMIEPVGEAMSSYLIYARLADRLGYGHLYPQSEEGMVEFVARDFPIDFDTFKASAQTGPIPTHQAPTGAFVEKKWQKGMLREDGKPGFSTPSGKWEIASTILKDMGHAALPVYSPAEEGLGNASLVKDFPLILTTGARIQSKFRSQHLNIPGLLKFQPSAEAILHADDAARRHIETGDTVWVKSPRGKVAFIARVTTAIKKGVVEVNQGGGAPLQAEGWRNSNANLLTDATNRDPISGFPAFKALLCEVEKQ